MQGEGGRKGERESREGGASEGGVRKGTLQWAREGKRERDTGTPSRKMGRGEEWIVEGGGGEEGGNFYTTCDSRVVFFAFSVQLPV